MKINLAIVSSDIGVLYKIWYSTENTLVIFVERV